MVVGRNKYSINGSGQKISSTGHIWSTFTATSLQVEREGEQVTSRGHLEACKCFLPVFGLISLQLCRFRPCVSTKNAVVYVKRVGTLWVQYSLKRKSLLLEIYLNEEFKFISNKISSLFLEYKITYFSALFNIFLVCPRFIKSNCENIGIIN